MTDEKGERRLVLRRAAQTIEDAPNGDEFEMVTGDALELLERAQIDVQIATAKRFPRSVDDFFDYAKSLATASREIATSCTYAIPRGEGDGGSQGYVTGPSVRLAEIAAMAWQNLKYGGRVVAVGRETVTCQGVCMDLENNISASVEVQRGILRSSGARYKPDMIRITGQAGIAIAIRNAIFKVIPASYVAEVQAEAQRVSRGEASDMPSLLEKTLERLIELGAKRENVLSRIGLKDPKHVTIQVIDMLNALGTSLVTGEATVAEIFPDPVKPIEGKTQRGKRGKGKAPTDSELAKAAELAAAKREELEAQEAANKAETEDEDKDAPEEGTDPETGL